MSDDVAGLIDFAAAPEVAPAEVTPEPAVEEVAPETESTVTEESAAPAEVAEGAEEGADEAPVDGRTNPAAIRSALKALRDSDPKNAPIARALNDAYGRYTAYKSVFPKVADAQNAKALIDAVGGGDGLTSLQETVRSINATDAKLYSGDASVLDDIIADMKAEGKVDAFGKLAPGFLEKLRSTDEKAYFAALKPHFYQGLRDVGIPGVIQALTDAMSGETPNVAALRQIVANLGTWFEDLKGSVDSASKNTLDPERQAFEQERTKFQTDKQAAFQEDVATNCDSHNNKALGGALKSYLKMPFFKNFSRESLIDLGTGLKQQLYSELKSDKTYQSQMDALFSQKSPDRAKIVSYHQAKVDTMAARIVKGLLERRYPGYAKGSPAAGQKAAGAKPAAQAQTPQSGKPKFVTSKPAWDDIDWDKDPNKMLFISGRAFLKTGQFIAWSPKYK